jgi:hypothetical protein
MLLLFCDRDSAQLQQLSHISFGPPHIVVAAIIIDVKYFNAKRTVVVTCFLLFFMFFLNQIWVYVLIVRYNEFCCFMKGGGHTMK